MVTWAHQPYSFDQHVPSPRASNFPQHSPGISYPFNGVPQSSPKHVIGNGVGFPHRSTAPSSPANSPLTLQTGERKNLTISTSRPKLTLKAPVDDDVFSSNSSGATIASGGRPIAPRMFTPGVSPSSPLSMRSSARLFYSRSETDAMSPTQRKPELNDKDFPPLASVRRTWGDRMEEESDNEDHIDDLVE